MAKGWYRESSRHALAAKGVRSAKDHTPSGIASANPKNKVLQDAMGMPPRPPRSQPDIFPTEKERKQTRNRSMTQAEFSSLSTTERRKVLDKQDDKNNAQVRAKLKANPKLKNKNFKQLQEAGTFLDPTGDFDKDGVQNSKDCQPLNPNKQGLEHDLAEQRRIVKKPFGERTKEEIALLDLDLTAQEQDRDSVASVVPERREERTRMQNTNITKK